MVPESGPASPSPAHRFVAIVAKFQPKWLQILGNFGIPPNIGKW